MLPSKSVGICGPENHGARMHEHQLFIKYGIEDYCHETQSNGVVRNHVLIFKSREEVREIIEELESHLNDIERMENELEAGEHQEGFCETVQTE